MLYVFIKLFLIFQGINMYYSFKNSFYLLFGWIKAEQKSTYIVYTVTHRNILRTHFYVKF